MSSVNEKKKHSEKSGSGILESAVCSPIQFISKTTRSHRWNFKSHVSHCVVNNCTIWAYCVYRNGAHTHFIAKFLYFSLAEQTISPILGKHASKRHNSIIRSWFIDKWIDGAEMIFRKTFRTFRCERVGDIVYCSVSLQFIKPFQLKLCMKLQEYWLSTTCM